LCTRIKAMGKEGEKKGQHQASSPKKPKKSKAASLDEMLAIYHFEYLGDNTDYVKGVYKATRLRNKIRQSMRLIVPPDWLKHPEAVKEHLQYRHPIHINGPRYKAIDEEAMQQALGYTRQEAERRHPPPEDLGGSDATLRYGVLGWTPLMQGMLHKEMWVLHTWGVNLESPLTTDGRYVLAARGKHFLARYAELTQRMVDIISAAAIEVRRQSGQQRVVVRVTGLGLGAWLAAISHEAELVAKVSQLYTDKLLSLAALHPWLQVRHPHYPDEVTWVSVTGFPDTGWDTEGEVNHDPFGEFEKRAITTMKVPYPADAAHLIVNAWDDASLIGNAGSLDPTLDGWMVAGGHSAHHPSMITVPATQQKNVFRLGGNASNASYLHNVPFAPELLDAASWLQADPQEMSRAHSPAMVTPQYAVKGKGRSGAGMKRVREKQAEGKGTQGGKQMKPSKQGKS